MPAKWWVIARNQYLIRTSRFRRVRRAFPFLVLVAFLAYTLVLLPAFVSSILDDVQEFFLSNMALVVLESIMGAVFIMLILIPITYTLQHIQPVSYEFVLSAPVRPSDMLLGKFLGDVAIYSIVVAFLAGTFAGLLAPLGIGAGQILIIVAVFVLVLFSAAWIGTVVAALIRSKLEKTARGRDLGKAVAFLLALPVVAVMYALMGAIAFGTWDTQSGGWVQSLLSLLPSSWATEIILAFARHPGDMAAEAFLVFTRFAALVIFFLVALAIGTLVARKGYDMGQEGFGSKQAKPDGLWYRTLERLGGGSLGRILKSVFKDYGRRVENISKLLYIVGLVFLIAIFFSVEADTGIVIMWTGFIVPFLAVYVIGEVTIRGKESLFIYRKAPKGERRLIEARLLHGLIMVLPLSVLMTIIFFIMIPGIPTEDLIIILFFVIASTLGYVMMSLGLFFLIPVFTEKPQALIGNMMVLMMFSIFLSIFCLIFFEGITFYGILIGAILAAGIAILLLGWKRLSRIE